MIHLGYNWVSEEVAQDLANGLASIRGRIEF
jgi:hypothetical protein